jgi:hypothetical protein
MTGFVVTIFCIYLHRNAILDLYTNEENVTDKKILSMAYVVLFLGNIFLWPIVVYIYVVYIISLGIPWCIELLKRFPNINIKVSKSDE